MVQDLVIYCPTPRAGRPLLFDLGGCAMSAVTVTIVLILIAVALLVVGGGLIAGAAAGICAGFCGHTARQAYRSYVASHRHGNEP